MILVHKICLNFCQPKMFSASNLRDKRFHELFCETMSYFEDQLWDNELNKFLITKKHLILSHMF